MKRKCIFSYYVHGVRPLVDGKPDYSKWEPGTNCYSEPREGIFHQWGCETTEADNGSIGTDTVAIIEDPADGKCYTAFPKHVQFIK